MSKVTISDLQPMANTTISDLQPVELEYAELSDLELETIAGGKCERTIIKDGEYIHLTGRDCRKSLQQ